MKVIFDSSALIPASKYAIDGKYICEYLAEYVDIHIPLAVANETAAQPDKFSSEAKLHGLISQRKIIVNAVHPTNEAAEILAGYKLGPGEREAILLYWQQPKKFDSLILDDYVATIVCRRLQIDCMLLLDLIVQLGREKIMPHELAIAMIYQVAPRYTQGFAAHSLRMLGEHKALEAPSPYELSKEALEAYLSGNFPTAGLRPEQVDLRQRLCRCYKEYAAGNLSLGWMAEHLRLSTHEIDGLLEQMRLPVAMRLSSLTRELELRSSAISHATQYKTSLRQLTQC
jgi:predicted nucleic acid-binding protein